VTSRKRVRSPKVRLNLRIIDAEQAGLASYVLIEGDQQTLRWLGNLLLEHAVGDKSCGRQFHLGPGSKFFARTAQFGLYLHLLPCDHPTDASEHAAGRILKGRESGG
jgi:hypothetical protein